MTATCDLAAIAKRATTDAPGAWVDLAAAAPLAGSATQVVQVAGLAAQVGGGALGRWGEAAGFIHGLHRHPLLAAGDHPAERRSLYRAEAVMRHCGGDRQAAWDLLEQGIASPADRVRYDGLLAQLLAVRGRWSEALPIAQRCAEACRGLAADDPVVAQTGQIAGTLARMAGARLGEAHGAIRAAAALAEASDGRARDWTARHRALVHQAEAQLALGEPAKALAALRPVFALEDDPEADPERKAATMALAARAYAAKGDAAAAARAEAASRELTARITRAVTR